jgi:mono/diheme cytochrome c family protein
MRRWSVRVGIALVVLAGAIQLVPFGRGHVNPPVVAEPAWDSAATRRLAVRACFDCHSNETVWPWYADIAPMSWLLTWDVREGRDELNFSEWEGDGDDAVETVLEGSMPPLRYEMVHSDARLGDDEIRALAQGLARTTGVGDRPGSDHD